jgi:predicted small lipoprotein YifL
MADLDRREFHKFTAAALGGLLAGTAAGCGGKGPVPQAASPAGQPEPLRLGEPAEIALTDKQVELLTDEIHACRGLNICKGLGRSKDNDCAGQGTCASVADSTCGGNNECATLGGCGETAGLNDCKGQGGCHIPLMDEAWTKARAAFEAAMKKTGKEFGPAPARK